jgi:hypothetical protein
MRLLNLQQVRLGFVCIVVGKGCKTIAGVLHTTY